MLKSKEEMISMSGYTKKDIVYYHHGFNAKMAVNISERLLLEKTNELFKNMSFPSPIKEITEEMLFDIHAKATRKIDSSIEEVKSQIAKLKERKDTLLNAFLDGDIEKADYKVKLAVIEKQMADLEKSLSKKPQLTKKKIDQIKHHSELLASL